MQAARQGPRSGAGSGFQGCRNPAWPTWTSFPPPPPPCAGPTPPWRLPKDLLVRRLRRFPGTTRVDDRRHDRHTSQSGLPPCAHPSREGHSKDKLRPQSLTGNGGAGDGRADRGLAEESMAPDPERPRAAPAHIRPGESGGPVSGSAKAKMAAKRRSVRDGPRCSSTFPTHSEFWR